MSILVSAFLLTTTPVTVGMPSRAFVPRTRTGYHLHAANGDTSYMSVTINPAHRGDLDEHRPSSSIDRLVRDLSQHLAIPKDTASEVEDSLTSCAPPLGGPRTFPNYSSIMKSPP